MNVHQTELELSIVVPCFNEAECIDEFYRRATEVAATVADGRYELVFVNDGSTDTTWDSIRRLGVEDSHVLGINLSRNHGHQLALTAGLDLCRGNRILILDADLQDPPELLPEMLETMREHDADVVYAVRAERDGETPAKRATAHLFYRLLASATETHIPVDTGDFRLMSRRALDVFLAMPEQARFIRGMVAWVGFRQVPFAYQRQSRFAGTTKYPLTKMIRFALDALTGFSSVPLKVASQAGFALAGMSLLLVVYIMAGWFSGRAVPGWTSLMLVVVMLGAIQMFVLGVMGEYIGRLYNQAKGRPLYIVQDIVGEAAATGHLGIDASAKRPAAVQHERGDRSDGDHRDNRPPVRSARQINK